MVGELVLMDIKNNQKATIIKMPMWSKKRLTDQLQRKVGPQNTDAYRHLKYNKYGTEEQQAKGEFQHGAVTTGYAFARKMELDF